MKQMKTILLSAFLGICISLPTLAQQDNDTNNETKWEKKGYEYYNEKNYKEALKCFRKQIEITPNSCDPYNDCALVLESMYLSDKDSTNLNEAIKNAEIAIRLCPDKALYKVNLAILKWKTMAYRTDTAAIYQDCMQLLVSVAKFESKAKNYYSVRGSLLMQYVKDNGTLAAHEDEIAYLLRKGYFVEKHSGAAYNLACLYSLLGEKDKALLWLEEALNTHEVKESDIDQDKDFDPVRQDERFTRLLQEHFHSIGIDIAELKEAAVVVRSDPEDRPFVTVEKMPYYPGGEKAMFEYLEKNIRIPEDGQKYGINQRIAVRFVVKKDGSIADATIVRSTLKPGALNNLYTNEAFRVVRSFPKWISGKQNERDVNVYYTLPITFKSEGSVEF